MKVEIIFTPPQKKQNKQNNKACTCTKCHPNPIVIPMPDADCYVKSNNQEL